MQDASAGKVFSSIRAFVFASVLLPYFASAEVVSTDSLHFSTSGQPLSLASDSIASFLPIYDKTTSRTEGTIRKVDLDGVSLATLQAAWEQGVSDCAAKSYGQNVVIAGILVAKPVSPTRSQCINGATIRYPTTGTCAGFPCVKWVEVTIPAAPPYPTSTSSDIFDAGARFALESIARIGFWIEFEHQTGTVDVDYATEATLVVTSGAGGEYTISFSEDVSVDDSRIVSQYSETDIFTIRLESTLTTSGTLTTCLPPDPCETDSVSEGHSLDEQIFQFVFDTSNTGLQGVIPDVRIEFLSENLINALDPPYTHPIAYEFGAQTLIDLGLLPYALEFNLGVPLPLIPSTAPIVGLPSFGVSFPFGDVGIYSPSLDLTETYTCAPTWDIGNPDISGCIDRFFVAANNDLRRVQEPAPQARTLLQTGVIEDVFLASDRWRFDLDIDFLLVRPAGLGVQVGVPLTASMTIDTLDFDLTTFWGNQQDLGFDANLEVTLNFSEPTLVEVAGEFEWRSSYVLSSGNQVVIKNPSPTMVINPVYSVASNQFTNRMDAYVDFSFEERVLGFQTSGALLETIGDLTGTDLTITVAALQLSQGLGDVKTKTLIDDTFGLTGFRTIAGAPISIGGSFDSDRDGLSDEEEAHHGTDPHDPDSDGDYVGDYDELRLTQTDPNVPDAFADLLVTERDDDTLLRVALVGPDAGQRTLLSGNGVGVGPAFDNPVGLAIEPDGSILVVNVTSGELLRVDATTGDRTLVSDHPGGTGTGPALHRPTDVLLESGTSALVADQGTVDRIFRVDLSTGDRTVVAELTGNGAPVYMAAEPSGTLLVALQLDNKVRRFEFDDSGTANEVAIPSPISANSKVAGVSVAPGGDIVVTSNQLVTRYDPSGVLLDSVALPQPDNRGVVAAYRGGALVASWDAAGSSDAIVLARFASGVATAISSGPEDPSIGFPEGLALRALRDGDGDGIGDVDEIRMGLDPASADTDGDGLGDGTEFGLPGLDADPATTTDPANADSDGDGFFDGDNGAGPCEDCNNNGQVDAGETDPNSPGVFIRLAAGLNLFSYPGASPPPTCSALAAYLGGFAAIESIARVDPSTGSFEKCDSEGGTDFSISTGEGYFVEALTPVSLDTPWSGGCPTRALAPGMNLVGHPSPLGLTCFDWLKGQAPGTVSSIQDVDPVDQRFRSCALHDGEGEGVIAVGTDFPIRAGRGYIFSGRVAGEVLYPGCP